MCVERACVRVCARARACVGVDVGVFIMVLANAKYCALQMFQLLTNTNKIPASDNSHTVVKVLKLFSVVCG